jgi:predicted ATPase/DNA-binding SARP family transcriptional activator
VAAGGRSTFRLLGPVEVLDPAGVLVPVGGRRRRALLAALLLHRGMTLPVERLVGMLWPEPPPTASTMVHGAVAGIRRALEPYGPPVLATRAGGYSLEVADEQVDAVRFERASEEGRRILDASPQRASSRLAEALAEWRGPALAGVEEPFARVAATRLEELHLQCHELLAQAELRVGRHHAVAARLEGLSAAHPLREDLCAHLVVALYRCGRQADALAAYRRLRAMLVEELGVEPEERLRRLELAVLRHDPWLQPPPDGRAALPAPLGSFVGRNDELDNLSVLLRSHRLVTLTGPGGVGKTRLAMELARRSTDVATVLVDLAPLTTPALVAERLADALGIRAEPGHALARTIAAALSLRPSLVVLDNCEHLVAACAELVQILLVGAAGSTVLATSREPLGVPGELAHPVRPLHAGGGDESWERIAEHDAVRLFVNRAAGVRSGFTLTAGNAALVAEVCRRLDGLPLAIELAAARVAALPLAELADRLDDRFTLLASATRAADPRHRSLAAAMSWGHDLQPAAERLLFARLAVFPASFDLGAARAICGGTSDILLPLARLVGSSMVQLDDKPDGDARYRLLESLRAYAGEQLDAPTRATLDDRHAAHYLALAEEAQLRLFAPRSGPWLARLHTERDNLRTALSWCFRADPERGVQLVDRLWHYWDIHGVRDEGLHWLHLALAVVGPDRPDRRLPLLSAAALLHVGRADLVETVRLATEQLALARPCDARRWEGDALALLATVDWARGRFDRARERYEDGIAASLADGDIWRAALAEAQLARLHRDRNEPDAARLVALRSLGHAEDVGEDVALGLALDVLASIEHRWGDETEAGHLVAEALEWYRGVCYQEGEASALGLAGAIALRAGRAADARDSFRAALELCRRIGHRAGTAGALEGLADVAETSGAADEAVALRTEASSLRAEIGVPRFDSTCGDAVSRRLAALPRLGTSTRLGGSRARADRYRR